MYNIYCKDIYIEELVQLFFAVWQVVEPKVRRRDAGKKAGGTVERDVDSPFVSNEGMFRTYRPKDPGFRSSHPQIFLVECTEPQPDPFCNVLLLKELVEDIHVFALFDISNAYFLVFFVQLSTL